MRLASSSLSKGAIPSFWVVSVYCQWNSGAFAKKNHCCFKCILILSSARPLTQIILYVEVCYAQRQKYKSGYVIRQGLKLSTSI